MTIHPTAIIGEGVELGVNVTIGPYTVVVGPCRIGDDVWIGPSTAIGTPAEMRNGEHPSVTDTPSGPGIIIGGNTIIREFVTVNQGTVEATHIGSGSYIMARAHVPHDAFLGDNCTVSTSAQIGGHSYLDDGANIGLGAVLHQFSVIGAYAMIGMQSAVTKPVPPFAKAFGVPARIMGVNNRAADRQGIDRRDQEAWSSILMEGVTEDSKIPGWTESAMATFRRACSERSRDD